jgi:hypothetical protein
MALRHSDAIEVKQIKGKSRGVFARRLIGDEFVLPTCHDQSSWDR